MDSIFFKELYDKRYSDISWWGRNINLPEIKKLNNTNIYRELEFFKLCIYEKKGYSFYESFFVCETFCKVKRIRGLKKNDFIISTILKVMQDDEFELEEYIHSLLNEKEKEQFNKLTDKD